MKNTTQGPAANLKTVRRLTREWLAAVRLEERCDDLAKSWKLAAASDRALARLRAAQNGTELEVAAPRTRRNLARCAFEALATIGKVIAGAVRRAESLRRAQVGAALWRAARKVRIAVRRTVSVIVSAVLAPKAASVPSASSAGAATAMTEVAPVVALRGRRALVVAAVAIVACEVVS